MQLSRLEDSNAHLQNAVGASFIHPCHVSEFGHDWRQIPELQTPGFVPSDLKKHRDGHVLIPAISITLLDLLKQWPERFGSPWFVTEEFASVSLTPGWFFFRSEPDPGSHGWDEQRLITPTARRLPHAIEVAYAIHLCWRVRDMPLLHNVYINTRDISSDGRRVCIASDHPCHIQIFKGKALIRGAA